MEKLFRVAVNQIDGFEEALVGLMGQEEVLKLWDRERTGGLHEAWKQSLIPKELEPLLVGLESGSYTDGKRKHEEVDERDLIGPTTA